MFFLGFLFSTFLSAQSDDGFLSLPNRLKFANHLFCEGDYLRAIDEYRFIHSTRERSERLDSLKFKIGLGFQKLGRFPEARMNFMQLFNVEKFQNESRFEFCRSFYLEGKYKILEERFEASFNYNSPYLLPTKKLVYLPKLYSSYEIEDSAKFFELFNESESVELLKFYIRKQNLEPKSPALAAILSGVLPGLGKIYTENYGDGITALLVTGLLTFLSIDNFNANHDFRGWLFGGLAAYFYAGNIYGSAASADIYNNNTKIAYDRDLKSHLRANEHYVPKSKWLCD